MWKLDQEEQMLYVIFTDDNGGILRADYWGGPYIALTFGHHHPDSTEVINVWDYEKGEPTVEFNVDAVRKRVLDWIEEHATEDPRWYEKYLENT